MKRPVFTGYVWTIGQTGEKISFSNKNRYIWTGPCQSDTSRSIIILIFKRFCSFFTVREKNREILVWCYQSEGLNKFHHLEVVVMLEVRKKEEIFPEEVLRVYRGILHLASKLGKFK